MVLLGAEAPERAGDEVFAAERAEDAVLGAAALPRHVSESDSGIVHINSLYINR